MDRSASTSERSCRYAHQQAAPVEMSMNHPDPGCGRPAAQCLLIALFAIAPLYEAAGQPMPLPAAPSCTGPVSPTPRQTEGPYYKPNSPRRHNLASSSEAGERIMLTGYVLTRNCRPVAGAVVDMWQTDARGAYDNAGFHLRGHEITDEQGRYWFETIVPAPYPGRTSHIHVKVRAPGQQVLTTQLYIPNEQRNTRDRIFNQSLLLEIERIPGARGEEPRLLGRYDFVLDAP
jgi:protocatechuate 3,4-dioxygenase beta subunit